MRMDKLTNPLQLALADAQSLALGRDHNFIEPQHLLVAMLQQSGGASKPLLGKAGVNLPALEAALEQSLTALPQVSGSGGEIHLSNEAGLASPESWRMERRIAGRPRHRRGPVATRRARKRRSSPRQ